MAAPNPPHAIHGKSIDEATEGDRIWFEQNHDRRYRIRNHVPLENNGPMELPPYGTTWRVVVVKIKEGVRIRITVALPAELPNEGADDEQLAALVDQVATPDFKKVIKAARKEWGKK